MSEKHDQKIYEPFEPIPHDATSYGQREYGYRLPVGIEVWDLSPGDPYVKDPQALGTEEGRGRAQDAFRNRLQQFGLPTEGVRLVFLQRIKYVNYSTPNELS